jgi:hypothetical protein
MAYQILPQKILQSRLEMAFMQTDSKNEETIRF